MKKLLVILICLMFTTAAMADPLILGADLAGMVCYPEGCDESTAEYVYRYAYPTIDGGDEVSQMINEFYAYMVEDALGFAAPMAAEEIYGSGIQAYTTITSEITCNSDDFFAVKVVSESFLGAAASSVVRGHVFARTGDKAGTVVSLPYLLGILDADETDSWLLDRQTAKADNMVRTLVWDVIQDQLSDGSVGYYDDLTYEILEGNFYPEEDFYLDADGNLIFFLQEGTVAPVTEGVLYFPFTLEELLDEI
ncbi:MAG: hypothetical protein E7316_08435 [Clostridiales bacterium]|nr:hypothetical protein [Clostridiales bacterium]